MKPMHQSFPRQELLKIKTKLLCIALLISFSVTMYPACLVSQGLGYYAITKERAWSVSVFSGKAFIGPTQDIEVAMKTVGLVDPTPGVAGQGSITPKKATPYTENFFDEWMIGVHYRFKLPYFAGVIISKTCSGETIGYSSSSGYLKMKHTVTTIAPVASYQWRWLRGGVGPAVHISGWDTGAASNSSTKFGLIFDIGITVTNLSRIFAECRLQYRYVGNVDVGPANVGSITFPKTSANYNHCLFGFGIGFRI